MKSNKDSINFLHKRFQFLEKSDVKLIFQFCDEKLGKTQRILMVIKDIKNPKCVTKVLLQTPEKAQTFLAGLQRQYYQKYGYEENTAQQSSKKQQDGDKLQFFYYVPMDIILTIMNFLDPYSFLNFSFTSKKIAKVSQSEASSEYFKVLCINLFERVQQVLPEPNRYEQVKRYVLNRPKQFGPNTKNSVINKLRYYVWQIHPVPTKQPPSYYQKFGGYKQLFLHCPRIHFNGFYLCKHQYRKQQGNKDILQTNATVHLVNYYRYIRFFDDGSVMCSVFPRKLKPAQILQILSAQNLTRPVEQIQQMKDLMLGEYLRQENRISIKAVKSGTIFNYELEILPNKEDNRVFSELLVRKYWLKVIDENDIIQSLEEADGEDGLKFRYYMHQMMAKQNSSIIRASSL